MPLHRARGQHAGQHCRWQGRHSVAGRPAQLRWEAGTAALGGRRATAAGSCGTSAARISRAAWALPKPLKLTFSSPPGSTDMALTVKASASAAETVTRSSAAAGRGAATASSRVASSRGSSRCRLLEAGMFQPQRNPAFQAAVVRGCGRRVAAARAAAAAAVAEQARAQSWAACRACTDVRASARSCGHRGARDCSTTPHRSTKLKCSKPADRLCSDLWGADSPLWRCRSSRKHRGGRVTSPLERRSLDVQAARTTLLMHRLQGQGLVS